MNSKEAKKILPKKEYEAFESIFMNQVRRTASAQLKQRATLARRLRDKYKDLAHQQIAEIRTRRTNEVDTDINDRRAGLFQEVIDFLEGELDQPRKAPVKSAKKKKIPRAQRALKDIEREDSKAMFEGRRQSQAPRKSRA